jgi:Cof subfamily protein (haloacid dehalogenase superfamily)
MSERNIIFFDIDGTLYNREKKLPASTKKAVKQLKDAGHIVAIATGRAPFMYDDLREELGINTYVSLNGQYVVLEGEVIYDNPLNRKRLEDITEVAIANDHPLVYLDDEDMYSNIPDHQYVTAGLDALKINRAPKESSTFNNDKEIYQTLLFCPESEEDVYKEQFTDAFKFYRWHPFSMDIAPKAGSKAEGIKKVTDVLGFQPDRQYAFGDGVNDIEMLTSIHNSCAMGNAKDEVKKVAKYVTTDVDEDGLYHGLRMTGLI